ncbi:MAG: hypothetical protein FWG91_13775 [Lachnospiraceae bacterium]|nr:hypothetical protein [Lachnospiraceae bacterium]
MTAKKNQREKIKKKVLAAITPTGRDEHFAAGKRGIKSSFKAEIWEFEYSGQTGLIYGGKEYAIYRTYGPKQNGKIELYAAERAGLP